jgi:hypothetical protein
MPSNSLGSLYAMLSNELSEGAMLTESISPQPAVLVFAEVNVPELFAERPRCPHLFLLAGVAGFFLTSVAACSSRIESPEVTMAPPSVSQLPAPIAEPLTPAPAPIKVSLGDPADEAKAIDGVNENVQRAIRKATRVVGTEASYLVVVAARESNFDPRKRARRTTATGLYQFTADTWLRSVRAFGDRHGLGIYASQIVVDRHGAISMRNAAARTKLLRLRADPEISALMAAELARDNEIRLEQILGRPVTPPEIYFAHLLGVTQGARLIEAARSAPRTSGERLFPAAARANPDLFKPHGRVASAHAIVKQVQIHYQRQELRFAGYVSTSGSLHAPTGVPDSLGIPSLNGTSPMGSLGTSLASVAP